MVMEPRVLTKSARIAGLSGLEKFKSWSDGRFLGDLSQFSSLFVMCGNESYPAMHSYGALDEPSKRGEPNKVNEKHD